MRLGDITLGLWGWEGIKLYFPPHTLQTSLFSVNFFWETSYRKVEQIIYAEPYFTFHCLCWGWGVKPSGTKMKHIPSSWPSSSHTWYLSRIPRIYLCKFFLAGINFYRFNAKNWHFRQILREKVAFFFTDLTWKIGIFVRFYAKKWHFFTDLTRKIGVFRCKFYSPKILPV